MIPANRVESFVDAAPFRPFRITLASGRTFVVRHPEMIKVTKSTMTLFVTFAGDAGETKTHPIEVSLLLTESIEPLDESVPPQGT